MRLTARLVQVAAIVAAASGCGGATASPTTQGDGGTIDASPDGVVGCGCGPCPGPAPSYTVTAAQACQMVEESFEISTAAFGATCDQVCTGTGGGDIQCVLPESYVSEVQALNPNPPSTNGAPWKLDCPTSPSTVTVSCQYRCVGGRLTDGYCAPDGMRDEGERLAAMAYLETVSVHAFDRLERELEVHRAPHSLLRDARRARRDEVRHTAMTTRLAHRHGASPRLPEAPAPARARTLFEVALENAVEGCIREAYGAARARRRADVT